MRSGLVLGLGLALAAIACSTPTPSDAELVAALRRSGVPEAEARCASAAILQNLSPDQVARLTDRGSSGFPADDPDRTDDPSDKVRAALLACRDQAITSTTVTATTVPEGATATSARGATAATASTSVTTSP